MVGGVCLVEIGLGNIVLWGPRVFSSNTKVCLDTVCGRGENTWGPCLGPCFFLFSPVSSRNEEEISRKIEFVGPMWKFSYGKLNL